MGITEVLLHEAFSPENYLQLIRVENRKSLIAGRFGEKIKGHDNQKSRLHWVTGGGGWWGRWEIPPNLKIFERKFEEQFS